MESEEKRPKRNFRGAPRSKMREKRSTDETKHSPQPKDTRVQPAHLVYQPKMKPVPVQSLEGEKHSRERDQKAK